MSAAKRCDPNDSGLSSGWRRGEFFLAAVDISPLMTWIER
jgi:hypothetical protein